MDELTLFFIFMLPLEKPGLYDFETSWLTLAISRPLIISFYEIISTLLICIYFGSFKSGLWQFVMVLSKYYSVLKAQSIFSAIESCSYIDILTLFPLTTFKYYWPFLFNTGLSGAVWILLVADFCNFSFSVFCKIWSADCGFVGRSKIEALECPNRAFRLRFTCV